jgi:hypothetical protein
MDTIKVGITHNGARAVVVHTAEGTLTIQPGQKLKDQEILPLSENKVDLYKSIGVKFSGLPKGEASDVIDTDELEEAVEVAQSDYNEAVVASKRQGAGDTEKKAVKEAADKLTAAQKALTDARK